MGAGTGVGVAWHEDNSARIANPIIAGSLADRLRRAATFAGAIAPVATAALAGGASALIQFSVRLMQPVVPMLAQPAEDLASAMAQLGTAILEWKLDGARVQVHKAGDEVRVFTRNLNDVTAAVPEIVSALRAATAKQLILDGEAIALRADGRPHPFQLTMRRFGRKLDVDALRGELPLSVFFFDCLYRDGAPLVDHPASERHDILRAVLPSEHVTPSLVTVGEPNFLSSTTLRPFGPSVAATALASLVTPLRSV